MVENQTSINADRKDLYNLLGSIHPELKTTVDAVVSCTYVDGALEKKMKYLLALAVALGTGCRMCILAQLTSALESGATIEEVKDVLSVVFAMKGTSGIAESLRIIQYLHELDEFDEKNVGN
ncbi:MAG: carboxymuconolactone decarboxylase family protein [Sphaerochaeta sp.]|nr:carboxymuconolactone decarboxylase family protein [Sphaerochaeta sp.]